MRTRSTATPLRRQMVTGISSMISESGGQPSSTGRRSRGSSEARCRGSSGSGRRRLAVVPGTAGVGWGRHSHYVNRYAHHRARSRGARGVCGLRLAPYATPTTAAWTDWVAQPLPPDSRGRCTGRRAGGAADARRSLGQSLRRGHSLGCDRASSSRRRASFSDTLIWTIPSITVLGREPTNHVHSYVLFGSHAL
jgi:hypothetical protein